MSRVRAGLAAALERCPAAGDALAGSAVGAVTCDRSARRCISGGWRGRTVWSCWPWYPA
ncbi:MAG TPA: hypothetical protein VKV80_14405 [Streptosporangiaceae bacterium]|nr:hypothetical protein [Streptosporangiaceae bacterium]